MVEPDQLEQQYGGTAPNRTDDFWPPKYANNSQQNTGESPWSQLKNRVLEYGKEHGLDKMTSDEADGESNESK